LAVAGESVTVGSTLSNGNPQTGMVSFEGRQRSDRYSKWITWIGFSFRTQHITFSEDGNIASTTVIVEAYIGIDQGTGVDAV
jgi:hypothetical protein